MSITELEKLRKLFKKYELSETDYYKDKKRGFTIITRPGIEKIQYVSKIKITFEMVRCEIDFAVVKATGKKGTEVIETFGGASPKNCMSNYYPEMAEKRAMARVVLKLENLYELGIFGEDEIEDLNKIIPEDITDSQQNTILRLLETSTVDSDTREQIENKVSEMSYKKASDAIQYLENNQKDPISSGDSYSAKDIQNKLNEKQADERA